MQSPKEINMVFANHNNLPLTVKEIAQAQKDDAVLKKLRKTDKYSTQLVDDTQVLCRDGKIVIPKFFSVEQLVGITTVEASWTHTP